MSTRRFVAATTPSAPVLPALVTVPNIELLEVGEDWATSTGVFSFTSEDLASAITSQEDPGVRTPVLKLGHVDPRFDGQPSLGRIQNMRVANNGQTLVGDLVGVPQWLAAVMASAYPRRSIEGWFEWDTRTGNTWPFVLTGLALLGDSYPAIDTLEDVQALWGDTPPPLYPVTEVAAMQASAPAPTHDRQIIATRLEDPMQVKAGRVAGQVAAAGVSASVALEDVRRAYYDSLESGQYWWWIRAVMLDPNELIVDDDEGGLYRVPFAISGDEVTFSDPVTVKVEYVDVAAGAASVAASAPKLPVATGQRVAAAFTTPGASGRPKVLAADTPAETPEPSATVPSTEPVTATTDTEGSAMTDEQRRALALANGLPDTATEAEVVAALVANVQTTADGSTPGTDGNPDSQPETPATDPAAQPAEAPDGGQVAEPPTTPTLPEGMVVIDAETLAQLQQGATAANELVAANRRAENDALLDGAIRAGKFPKARRPHYEALLAADPEGTKNMLQTMASGVIPVQELGVTVGEGEGGEAATAYPESWGKSVSAARRGAAARVKTLGD